MVKMVIFIFGFCNSAHYIYKYSNIYIIVADFDQLKNVFDK